MSIAEDQASDFLAPEVDKILAITVDATSRQYDLSLIDLGTPGADVGGTGGARSIFVTILADGADVYWALDDTAGRTISESTVIAAGAAPAFGVGQCWKCPSGSEQSRRVDRTRMRYLYLKGSGAGTARIMASSFASNTVAPL